MRGMLLPSPPSSSQIPEDQLVCTSGSWPRARAHAVNRQSGIWFLQTLFVYPLPPGVQPLSQIGDIGQLWPLRQGGHHVFQFGADGRVVIPTLFGQFQEAVL